MHLGMQNIFIMFNCITLTPGSEIAQKNTSNIEPINIDNISLYAIFALYYFLRSNQNILKEAEQPSQVECPCDLLFSVIIHDNDYVRPTRVKDYREKRPL